MILRRLSLVVLGLMLLANSVGAQDSARIEGTVTDASDAVYAGAVVHLIEWRGNARGLANIAPDESVACDSNGRYSFSVSAGIYDITISAITQSPVIHLPRNMRYTNTKYSDRGSCSREAPSDTAQIPRRPGY